MLDSIEFNVSPERMVVNGIERFNLSIAIDKNSLADDCDSR